MDGADGKGRLRILSEQPCGKIAENLLKEGVRLGVSSRGSGEVNESFGTVSDFEIVTLDIVVTPSAPNAYPLPIYESKRFNRLYDPAFDATQAQRFGYLNEQMKAERFLEQEIKRFLKSLK